MKKLVVGLCFLLMLLISLLTAYWFLIANQPTTSYTGTLPKWAKEFPEIKGLYSYYFLSVDVYVTYALVKRNQVDNQLLANNVLSKIIEEDEYLKKFPQVKSIRLVLQTSLWGSDPAFSFHVPLSKKQIYEKRAF